MLAGKSAGKFVSVVVLHAQCVICPKSLVMFSVHTQPQKVEEAMLGDMDSEVFLHLKSDIFYFFY